MYTLVNLAKEIGVSKSTISNWVKSGKVKLVMETKKEKYISKHEFDRIVNVVKKDVEQKEFLEKQGLMKCNQCEKIISKDFFCKRGRVCCECTKKWHANNYVENRKDILKRNSEWEKNNKDKRKKIADRRLSVKKIKDKLRIYNLTMEQYEKLQDRCGGRCEICKKECNLYIDHNHKNNLVRGMLCNTCNAGIGFLKDDKNVLQAAIDYLDRNDEE